MRSSGRMVALLVCLSCVLAVGPGLAGPIHYDEAVDGPLPRHPQNDVSPDDFLTLGVGLNTIAGTAIWSAIGGATTFDTAPLILPEGMFISSIAFSAEKSGGEGLLSITQAALFGYDEAFDFLGLIDRYTAAMPFEGSLFEDFLPLESGNYSLCLCGFGGLLQNDQFVTTDYLWSVEVASTPEPAVAWLGIAGLFLAVLRRRG